MCLSVTETLIGFLDNLAITSDPKSWLCFWIFILFCVHASSSLYGDIPECLNGFVLLQLILCQYGYLWSSLCAWSSWFTKTTPRGLTEMCPSLLTLTNFLTELKTLVSKRAPSLLISSSTQRCDLPFNLGGWSLSFERAPCVPTPPRARLGKWRLLSGWSRGLEALTQTLCLCVANCGSW